MESTLRPLALFIAPMLLQFSDTINALSDTDQLREKNIFSFENFSFQNKIMKIEDFSGKQYPPNRNVSNNMQYFLIVIY